jgi:hypothetical protein
MNGLGRAGRLVSEPLVEKFMTIEGDDPDNYGNLPGLKLVHAKMSRR